MNDVLLGVALKKDWTKDTMSGYLYSFKFSTVIRKAKITLAPCLSYLQDDERKSSYTPSHPRGNRESEHVGHHT